MKRDISIVIPVHDEAGNVESLVAEIETALGDRTDYEIVIVDDASRDGTGERLAELRQRCARLRVAHHARRSGQSAAILSGVRMACGRWIVTMDGDGQNVAADIPELLAARDRTAAGAGDPAAAQRPLLLAGIRCRRRDPWPRRLASRIANRVRGALLGDRFPDTGCGLKLIRRDLYLQLPQFDHMHRFLPALVQRQGGVVVGVPVDRKSVV